MADETTGKHDALVERVRSVETAMTELSTIKKLLAGLFLAVLPAAGAFVYQTIAQETRIAYLEEARRQDTVLVRETQQDLATLTTDVRVLATSSQSGAVSSTTKIEELRTRLERLESERRNERERRR
jgi:hypothetical protein